MENLSESKSKWRYVGIVGLALCVVFSIVNIRNIVVLKEVFAQVGFERYNWFLYILAGIGISTLMYALYALIVRKPKNIQKSPTIHSS